jgi:hypothetical protein
MITGILSKGYSSQGVILTMHFYLQPRFRMSGSISLLPTYTSIVWTGINVVVLLVVVIVVIVVVHIW